MTTVYRLNSENKTHFICLHIFTLSDDSIYVEYLDTNKWKLAATIGPSKSYKQLEVNGVIIQGDTLARLLSDMRPKTDKTHYNLRVNCDGLCYIHNSKAQDVDGTKLTATTFDWSNYGVPTIHQQQLRDKEQESLKLLQKLKTLEEECGKFKAEEEELRMLKMEMIDKEWEMCVWRRKLEKEKKLVGEMEVMLDEKEMGMRMLRWELKDVKEEVCFYKNKGEKVDELEKEVFEKGKEIRMLKWKLSEVEDEAVRMSKLLKEMEISNSDVIKGSKEMEWCKMKLKMKEEELSVANKLLEWKDKVLDMKDRVLLGEIAVDRDVVEFQL
ncbi:hypothetical protein LINPERHAP2_LOCUS14586 [Linum perenne]